MQHYKEFLKGQKNHLQSIIRRLCFQVSLKNFSILRSCNSLVCFGYCAEPLNLQLLICAIIQNGRLGDGKATEKNQCDCIKAWRRQVYYVRANNGLTMDGKGKNRNRHKIQKNTKINNLRTMKMLLTVRNFFSLSSNCRISRNEEKRNKNQQQLPPFFLSAS